jgi:hypothetical protein
MQFRRAERVTDVFLQNHWPGCGGRFPVWSSMARASSPIACCRSSPHEGATSQLPARRHLQRLPRGRQEDSRSLWSVRQRGLAVVSHHRLRRSGARSVIARPNPSARTRRSDQPSLWSCRRRVHALRRAPAHASARYRADDARTVDVARAADRLLTAPISDSRGRRLIIQGDCGFEGETGCL